jgi:hypothetical protein
MMDYQHGYVAGANTAAAQITNLTRQLAEVQAKADELGKQNYRLIQELAEANAAFSEAVHVFGTEADVALDTAREGG